MADSAAPLHAQIRPDVWLDARRALWLPAHELLVVADLHWGYATGPQGVSGAWGDEEIRNKLNALIADYQPAEMIWLGNSLHTPEGHVVAEAFLDAPRTPPTIVVAGNHDLRWSRAIMTTVVRGQYFFHHGDARRPVPEGCTEVMGHYHPAVAWSEGASGRLKLPAMVESPRRFILPAFSPWAGATPWNTFAGEDECLWAVSPRRVFRFQSASSPKV